MHHTIAVALLLPQSTFDAVFQTSDVARLVSHHNVHLLCDRPLDRERPADRALLAQAEAVITGWGTAIIDGPTLEVMPNLRAVAHAAGSVRTIVDPVVYDHGVTVCSAARQNAVPVAEFTIAIITLAAKRAFWASDTLRGSAQGWSAAKNWPPIGAYRHTVGIIGASVIGRMVLERLQEFDFEVLLADPTLSADAVAELGVEHVDLPELFDRCEIVSLHAPLIPTTYGMITREHLQRLRPGASFINTARGALVDEDALADVLETSQIHAFLDVFAQEPLPLDSRLRSTPNTFLTPHIAGSQGTEFVRLSAHAIDEIIAFAETGEFKSPIRADSFAALA